MVDRTNAEKCQALTEAVLTELKKRLPAEGTSAIQAKLEDGSLVFVIEPVSDTTCRCRLEVADTERTTSGVSEFQNAVARYFANRANPTETDNRDSRLG